MPAPTTITSAWPLAGGSAYFGRSVSSAQIGVVAPSRGFIPSPKALRRPRTIRESTERSPAPPSSSSASEHGGDGNKARGDVRWTPPRDAWLYKLSASRSRLREATAADEQCGAGRTQRGEA